MFPTCKNCQKRVKNNKAKQSFSNDREHGRLKTFFKEQKQIGHVTVSTFTVYTLQYIFRQNMKIAMKWKSAVYTLQYMMGIDTIFRQNVKMAMEILT